MKEIWKIIDDYPDYVVSNCGRVKRINLYHNSNKNGLLKLMKSHINYKRVSLSRNNIPKNKSVHVLVAKTFIGKIPNGYHVNHKDCNPSNNHVNNLEIVTPQENVLHQIKMGRIAYGVRTRHAKLNPKKVKLLRHMKRDLGMYYKDIAKFFKISIATAYSANTKETWNRVA